MNHNKALNKIKKKVMNKKWKKMNKKVKKKVITQKEIIIHKQFNLKKINKLINQIKAFLI